MKTFTQFLTEGEPEHDYDDDYLSHFDAQEKKAFADSKNKAQADVTKETLMKSHPVFSWLNTDRNIFSAFQGKSSAHEESVYKSLSVHNKRLTGSDRPIIKKFTDHSQILNNHLTSLKNSLKPAEPTLPKSFFAKPENANDTFFHQDKYPDYKINAARHIDKMMTDTHQDHTVYSGIRLARHEQFNEAMDKHPQKLFTTKGFMSTSPNPAMTTTFSRSLENGAGHGAILAIHLPKGHPALYTRPMSTFPEEHEMLLPRDSLFKHSHSEIHEHLSGTHFLVHHVEAILPKDYEKHGHKPYDHDDHL